MNENFKPRFNAYLQQVNDALPGFLPQGDAEQKTVFDAMSYSLMAGGKRIRAIMVMAFCELCGGNPADAVPFAAAIEMIHAYSLIHDDLPAMDDDDLRRGKPTCHKAYDEATAILAGDALLTNAFSFMARADAPASLLLEAVRLTADAAGAAGMVGGQVLDLAGEGRRLSLEELRVLNAKKTGALIYNACECGAVLAGAPAEKRAAMRAYGAELGIAFQITDDILDVIGDEATVGKEVRHDAESEKATWPSLLGLEASIERARRHCAAAEAALEDLFSGADADFLRETARKLVNRTH